MNAISRTYQEWWLIGTDGERKSRESVLSVPLDDNNICNPNSTLAQLAGAVKDTASLQRGKNPAPNEYPGYESKQSDSEATGMQSTSSLPLLPGPPGVVAPDRVLSMGQIELFDI